MLSVICEIVTSVTSLMKVMSMFIRYPVQYFFVILYCMSGKFLLTVINMMFVFSVISVMSATVVMSLILRIFLTYLDLVFLFTKQPFWHQLSCILDTEKSRLSFSKPHLNEKKG